MEEKRLKTLDEWFEEVSVEIDNAEFVECTGTYNGKKVAHCYQKIANFVFDHCNGMNCACLWTCCQADVNSLVV